MSENTDASSAPSTKCEIKSSCPLSAGCQFTNQMIVDPGSTIPTNCSIFAGGKAKVVTWNQAKQRVGTSNGGVSDLVLKKVSSSASGSYSCECTSVNFTRKYTSLLTSVFQPLKKHWHIASNEFPCYFNIRHRSRGGLRIFVLDVGSKVWIGDLGPVV